MLSWREKLLNGLDQIVNKERLRVEAVTPDLNSTVASYIH